MTIKRYYPTEPLFKLIDFNLNNSTKDEVVALVEQLKADQGEHRVFYPKNNLEILLNVKGLKDEFDRLNLTTALYSMAIHVVPPRAFQVPHIDADESTHKYSLNLPILNVDNTWVEFYDAQEKPRDPIIRPDLLPGDVLQNKVRSYEFHKGGLESRLKFSMTSPAIINTCCPHRVFNRNDNTRITILCRLKWGFDLSHYGLNNTIPADN